MSLPYWIATTTAGNNLAMRHADRDLEAGVVQALLTSGRNGVLDEATGEPVLPPPETVAQIVNEVVANAVNRAPPLNPNAGHDDEITLETETDSS